MRRAINGKLREESKDYPGYFKYEFEIREEDGSTNKVPVYGVDMQDALSRIVKQEKIKRVKKIIKIIPDWAFLTSWFLYMGGVVGLGQYLENPTIILIGLILPFIAFLGIKFWYSDKTFKL
jgi:hypothetical protein